MSYILDALQRADAERARGGVPTLHARPLATPLEGNGLSKPQRAGIAIGAVLVVVAAALAWWWWSRPAMQPTVAAQAPAAVPAPATLVPLPTPVPLPTRAVAAVTVAQAPPPPAVAEKPVSTAPVAEPATATVPKPKAVAAASAPITAEVPTATPALAPLLSELPESTRRQIPAMAISGAVYSENPSQRLLLVNGLVLNQGAQVAPDLTVLEIRSNNSEFNFRGTRFRVVH